MKSTTVTYVDMEYCHSNRRLVVDKSDSSVLTTILRRKYTNLSYNSDCAYISKFLCFCGVLRMSRTWYHDHKAIRFMICVE
jgi:hypothetical protein